MEDNKIHKRSEYIRPIEEFSNLKELLSLVRKKHGKANAYMYKTDTPDVYTYITYNEFLDRVDAFRNSYD